MYITVEGVIGAGKTTLTAMIGQEFDCKMFYEVVEENPLLEKFYQDQEKWAMQTEMFFLTSRYQQLKEIDKLSQGQKQKVVADYNIMKNLIFAKETLNEIEYQKFLQVFEILTNSMVEANLVIVINSSIKTLKKNIKKRGREYEKSISDLYLDHLIKAYQEYIKLLQKNYQNQVLIINGDDYDFVNQKQDYQKVMNLIRAKIKELNE